MNGLLEYTQTAGGEWRGTSAEMLYHPLQEAVESSTPRQQITDFTYLEEEMRRFESDYDALICEVRKCYVMPSDPSVEVFFRRSRSLPHLLVEAVPHLRRFFGDTVFALRHTSDEYGFQVLMVDALWPGEARDAERAIDAFEDAWWIGNSRSAFGGLIFTYRLV